MNKLFTMKAHFSRKIQDFLKTKKRQEKLKNYGKEEKAK